MAAFSRLDNDTASHVAPAAIVWVPAATPSPPPVPQLRARNSTAISLAVGAVPVGSGGGCNIVRLTLLRATWLPPDALAAAWASALGGNASLALPPGPGWSPDVTVLARNDDVDSPLLTRIVGFPGAPDPPRALVQGMAPGAASSLSWPLAVDDGGLVRATSYRYRVQVWTRVGPSDMSQALIVDTLPSAPSAPLALALAATGTGPNNTAVSPVTIALTWLYPADDGGRSVVLYRVEAIDAGRNDSASPFRPLPADPAQQAWALVATPPISSVTLSGLSPSTWYYLRATAGTSVGVGPPSSPPLLVRTLDPYPCAGLPDPYDAAAATAPPQMVPVGGGGGPTAPAYNASLSRGRCSGNGVCHAWAGTCSCNLGYSQPGCAFGDGVSWNLTLILSRVPGGAAAFNRSTFEAALALMLRETLFDPRLLGASGTATAVLPSPSQWLDWAYGPTIIVDGTPTRLPRVFNASRVRVLAATAVPAGDATRRLQRAGDAYAVDAGAAALAARMRGGSVAPHRSPASTNSMRQLQATDEDLVVTIQLTMSPLERATRHAQALEAYAARGSLDAMTVPPVPTLQADGEVPTLGLSATLQALMATGSPRLAAMGISMGTLVDAWSPSAAPITLLLAPIDCAALTTCGTCLAARCGWCTVTSSCGAGTRLGPLYSVCPMPSVPPPDPAPPLDAAGAVLSAYYYHGDLPGARSQCLPECWSFTTCSECTLRADCGFCQGLQQCHRVADLSRGLACGNSTSAWVRTYDTCAAQRCRQFTSRWLCTQDPFCGYCEATGSLQTTSICGAGDA